MPLVFAATLVLFASGQASADAAHPPAHAARLDSDAALYARVDLPQIQRVSEAAEDLSSRVGRALRMAQALSPSQAGAELFSAAWWRERGFDPGRPLFVSALALDEGAAEAVLGPAAAPPVFWRSRVVLPLAEVDAAEATLRGWAGALPGLEALGPGGERARPDPDPRRFVGPGALAAGRVAGQRLWIVARRRDDVITIDLLSPFAAPSGAEAAAAFRVAARPGRGAPETAARALSAPGIALWTEPPRALGAASLAHRRALSRTLARTLRLTRPLPVPADPDCQPFRELAKRGALADVTARVRGRSEDLRARFEWTIRSGSALADYLESGEGLPLPAQRADLAIAWSLTQPARLEELPHPSALARPLREVRRHAASCGLGAEFVLWLFAWPELAGALFDQLASVGPRTAAISSAVGPGAAALRSLRSEPERALAAVEVALARNSEVAPLVEELLRRVFGSPRPGPPALERLWGRGRIRPFRRSYKGETAFGAGRGDPSISWYLGGPRERAAPPEAWLWAQIEGGRAADAVGAFLPALAPWLDRGGDSLGAIEGAASAAPDRIELKVAIELE